MEGPASEQLRQKLARLNFSQLAELERFIDFILQRDGLAQTAAPPVNRPPVREPVLNRPRESDAAPRTTRPPRSKSEPGKPLDISAEGIRKAILEIFNEYSATFTSGLLISTLEGVWKRYGWPEAKLVEGVEALLEDGIFSAEKLDPPRFMLTRKGFELLREQAPSEPVRQSRPPQTAEPKLTEAHLRSAILGLYQQGKVKRGMVLSGEELGRLWNDVKIRAEHLRTGLEILEGQGYLRLIMEGGSRSFKLTEEGFLYLTGRPTPEGLMALAGEQVSPRNRPARYPDADVLQRAVLDLFKMHHAEIGSRVTFAIMRLNWRPTGLRDDDLVRGLEILLKEGMVDLDQGSEPAFRLTQTGYKSMNAWTPLASLKKRLTVGQI